MVIGLVGNISEDWPSNHLKDQANILGKKDDRDLMAYLQTVDTYTMASLSSSRRDRWIGRNTGSIKKLAMKSFMMIPDHSKVNEDALGYMTKDLFDALAAAWDVPQWVRGEIGNEDFLYYFVTGNDISHVDIRSVTITSKNKCRCDVDLKYAQVFGDDSEYLQSISLNMVYYEGMWLLDDFRDGVKARCMNYILEEIENFQSGKTHQYMEENGYDDAYIAEVNEMFNDYISKYQEYIEYIETIE